MEYFPKSTLPIVIQLADDNPHPLTTTDIPYYTLNIFCYDNAVYHGVAGVMKGKIFPNDCCWYEYGNAKDILVQNVTAGSNGLVVAIATVPNRFVKEALGI